MNIYETTLTEYRSVKIRVRANSASEAEDIYNEFSDKESDYLAEELDLNGDSQWTTEEFKKVHPVY